MSANCHGVRDGSKSQRPLVIGGICRLDPGVTSTTRMLRSSGRINVHMGGLRTMECL